jgi:hypothetical protein
MKAAVFPPPGELATCDSQPVLKILILYQEFQCGLRAMQIYKRLHHDWHGDFAFQLDLWNPEVLEIPHLNDRMSRQFRDADMILLGLGGDRPVSDRLLDWMEGQTSGPNNDGRALVVVLESGRPDLGMDSMLRQRLKNLAFRQRMDFLVAGSEIATQSRNEESPSLRERADFITPILRNCLHRSGACQRWGLNE